MEGKRDQEMHQTKNGKNYYFGTKEPIGADAESGLVYLVHDTAADVANVTEVAQLLHGAVNSSALIRATPALRKDQGIKGGL